MGHEGSTVLRGDDGGQVPMMVMIKLHYNIKSLALYTLAFTFSWKATWLLQYTYIFVPAFHAPIQDSDIRNVNCCDGEKMKTIFKKKNCSTL